MSLIYTQKQASVQKKNADSVASVLDSSSQSESLQRKADMANNAVQCAETLRPNNTGMPDNLKSGIESLSGFSMDNVRVHYNSSKPATVQALAYTQGTDIHVAPGQEKCLPHEAWHVAQQMAGRVSPTTNINGMPVNDNAALEHEADVMGEKAVQCKNDDVVSNKCEMNNGIVQCDRMYLRTYAHDTYGATFVGNKGQINFNVRRYRISPYQVWRDLVNAYDLTPGPNERDPETEIDFIYNLDGRNCRTTIVFSYAKKGYIIQHEVDGRSARISNGQEFSDVSFSAQHSTESEQWEKETIGESLKKPVNMGRAADAASKIIAERGRFECLKYVNSDDMKVWIFQTFFLFPDEVWGSFGKMINYREFAKKINEYEGTVDGLDTFVDAANFGYVKRSWNRDVLVKKILSKQERLRVYDDLPIRDCEIFDAIHYFNDAFFSINYSKGHPGSLTRLYYKKGDS